ncbi:DUF6249 domain-containing protein [Polaribacter gangjinensis]|uniref:DUF6249 domain-containing protein n=1 Tax=Polaribacter gangjinensis TaxID=574710 RepID=A0A2S7W8C0_9FLAO|nr:DUF6249 domain-containing protein [Polaribacter gangjinensis]PQJ73867.1 hypothetical protein BTO13_00605 [Polaribacter gangjinensis]
MEEVGVLLVIFGSIFGVFYLYFSTRNKERLALIEKGVDASIFMKGHAKKAAPFWKILILNLGLLACGIGFGILLGAVLALNFAYDGPWENRPSIYISPETFYAASIFICAGASLLIGFTFTKKLDKE